MKKIKTLVILGLLLMFFVSKAQTPLHYIKTDKYEGVIFSKLPNNPIVVNKPLYIPTVEEVAKMEKAISGSVGKLFFARCKLNHGYQYVCDFEDHLQEYKRHYFGDWNNDDKEIVVLFFKEAKNWKKSWFLISDGGCDYFQIRYSVKSGTFYHLIIGQFI